MIPTDRDVYIGEIGLINQHKIDDTPVVIFPFYYLPNLAYLRKK